MKISTVDNPDQPSLLLSEKGSEANTKVAKKIKITNIEFIKVTRESIKKFLSVRYTPAMADWIVKAFSFPDGERIGFQKYADCIDQFLNSGLEK